MSQQARGLGISACTFFLAASQASAQPTFQRTKIVDPNGTPSGNFATIQAAVDDVPDNPADRYTILIYSGLFSINTSISLGDIHENIDLVGVDRDAVIINMVGADAAIKITSGGEQSRNNSIRNLTIKSALGPGIVVNQGNQVPRNMVFENLTIEASGSGNVGIDSTVAEGVTIRNCSISTGVTSGDGHGILPGSSTSIIDTTITPNGSGRHGVLAVDETALTMQGCTITAPSAAVRLEMGSTYGAVTLERCVLTGGSIGFDIFGGDSLLMTDCVVSAAGLGAVSGVRFSSDGTHPLGSLLAFSNKISAISTGAGQTVRGVEAISAPADPKNQMRFENCEISATSKNATAGQVAGVWAGQADAVVVVGGKVSSASVDASGVHVNEAANVYDLENAASGGGLGIRVSGAEISKWKGGIRPAERPRPVIQRTINVAAAGGTIHAGVPLGSVPTAPTGQPGVYRVLSIRGNDPSMSGNVYIVGTDWGGNPITDVIALNGQSVVQGVKPFKAVTWIVVPSGSSSYTVAVSTTNKLGLYKPISAETDVIQQGRKAQSASSYTLEPSVGTVDAVYATVNVAVTAGDSFEWALLASE